MADEMLKTYRVIRGTLKVGDSVRQYGDFVPEAESWPNVAVYLRSGYIEVVYATQKNIDDNLEEVAARVVSEVIGADAESETPSPVSESVEESKTGSGAKQKSKKRVVVRRTKNEQEGRTEGAGGSGEGPVLAESSV